MSVYHYIYPNRHYIHFGYFIRSNKDKIEGQEYVLSPSLMYGDFLSAYTLPIHTINSELERFVCKTSDLKRSEKHQFANDNWLFVDFHSFQLKRLVVMFIKEYLEKVTERHGRHLIYLCDSDIRLNLPLRMFLSGCGYQDILFQSSMWYYLDNYRVLKFVNKCLFMVVDCVGDGGKHIYFQKENDSITTRFFVNELSKANIVKKLFSIVSMEYQKSYYVDLSTNESYSSVVKKTCEEAFMYLKNGGIRTTISLSMDDHSLKVSVTESNIRYIEQQLVLNHIRSTLNILHERLGEIAVVLLGEGRYYNACKEIFDSAQIAEKVTYLPSLPTPFYSKFLEGSIESGSISVQNTQSQRPYLFSSFDSCSPPIYSFPDLEVMGPKEFKKKQNEITYTNKIVAPLTIHISGLDALEAYQNSLPSIPCGDNIPQVRDVISIISSQINKVIFTLGDSSYTLSLDAPYYWILEKMEDTRLISFCCNSQLIHTFLGRFSHSYDPYTNIHSYRIQNTVVLTSDGWLETTQFAPSYYIKHYLQFDGLDYNYNKLQVLSDQEGNVDIYYKSKFYVLGSKRCIVYEDEPGHSDVTSVIHTVLTAEPKNNENTKKEEEGTFSQCNGLDGDQIENSWVQSIFDLFQTQDGDVSDVMVEEALDKLIDFGKTLPPSSLAPSSWYHLFHSDPVAHCQDVSYGYNLELSETDDVTSLDRYPFEYTNIPNQGRLVTLDGSLVFCGEVKENRLNGKGSWFYKNGKTCYEGEYKNNKRHGYGKYYFPSGTLMYEGEWKYDKMDGHGRLYKPVNMNHSNSDVRQYIIQHGANNENLSFSEDFDLYSLGSTL